LGNSRVHGRPVEVAFELLRLLAHHKPEQENVGRLGMTSQFKRGLGLIAAIAAVAAWAATAPAKAADGPFSGLGGSWNGSGHIELSNGTRERIRCRANYAVGPAGTAMHQALRCASDSYNFELRSDVESRGNHISGNWAELSRNISGELSGHGRRGHIEVMVKSGSFTAELILVSHGNRQSVIIRSKGTQFSGASISLTRRG
jgi:hypothetical protein